MMYSRPSAKRMIMRRDVIERALPSCVIRAPMSLMLAVRLS